MVEYLRPGVCGNCGRAVVQPHGHTYLKNILVRVRCAPCATGHATAVYSNEYSYRDFSNFDSR